MASPRAAISIIKSLSPQKIPNLSIIRQALSSKSPGKSSLCVENAYKSHPVSPILTIDSPCIKRIVHEGFLNKSQKVLGSGAFGKVYKVRYKGNEVAAKIIKNDKKNGRLVNIEKQASFLRHSNIVNILKVDEGPALTLITMELCGNSLQNILEENSIKKEQRIHIWKSIAKALKYCHRNGVVHADVKPKNVLMGSDNEPKLADFGNAIFTKDPYNPSDFHGTPGYIAPEILCGNMPTHLSDIYSLGVLAWQMLSRKPPFADLHKHTILYLTGKGITPSDFDLEDEFEGRYKDLYKRSWNIKCEERPALNTIIEELNRLETLRFLNE